MREIYGHDGAETLIENHAMQIMFAPKNSKVARDISDTLGYTTINNKSRSKQLSGKGGRSESISDHQRALLLPQEIIQLGQNNELLLLENSAPIKCNKIRWYQDKSLKQRGNSAEQQHWPQPNVHQVKPNQPKTIAASQSQLDGLVDQFCEQFAGGDEA